MKKQPMKQPVRRFRARSIKLSDTVLLRASGVPVPSADDFGWMRSSSIELVRGWSTREC